MKHCIAFRHKGKLQSDEIFDAVLSTLNRLDFVPLNDRICSLTKKYIYGPGMDEAVLRHPRAGLDDATPERANAWGGPPHCCRGRRPTVAMTDQKLDVIVFDLAGSSARVSGVERFLKFT